MAFSAEYYNIEKKRFLTWELGGGMWRMSSSEVENYLFGQEYIDEGSIKTSVPFYWLKVSLRWRSWRDVF